MTTVPVTLEMSAALMDDVEPKTFCDDQRRDNRGHVAVTCRLHMGHDGPHVDVHAGRRWTS